MVALAQATNVPVPDLLAMTHEGYTTLMSMANAYQRRETREQGMTDGNPLP